MTSSGQEVGVRAANSVVRTPTTSERRKKMGDGGRGAAPVIRLRRVTFRYGRRMVFDGLDADIRRGLNFVIGVNGVGKTTLFNLIRGRLAAGGDIDVDTPGAGAHNRSLVIGYLPQNFQVPPGLTAREFVEYVAWVRGMPRRQLGHAATAALQMVGLVDRADERLATLSGGYLRRVGIAQAMVNGCGVLLLDEPTVGLDPIQRSQLRAALAELGRSLTVVVSTHLLEDVPDGDSWLIVLGRGRALFQGSVNELRQRMRPEVSDTAPTLEEMFVRLHNEVER